MKQLSDLSIAELGIEQMFASKQWAYVAVVGEHCEARLGIACANEPGYSPVPEHWANGSYGEMSAEADRLNAARGISEQEAARVVSSSMARGRLAG